MAQLEDMIAGSGAPTEAAPQEFVEWVQHNLGALFDRCDQLLLLFWFGSYELQV